MSPWREHCVNRPDDQALTKLSEFITLLSRQATEEMVENPIVVLPPKVTVLQTTVYSSHYLDVYYGLCDNDKLPESDSIANRTKLGH